MQLHQLLRMLEDIAPLCLLDLKNEVLFQGVKKNIPTQFYEDNVFRIKVHNLDILDQSYPALFLILEK